jgi:hypothetical protein
LPNHSLSPGGLAIPGLNTAPLAELLALPPRRREIQERLADTFARIDAGFNRNEERARRAEHYEAAQAALIRGLWDINALADSAAETALWAMRHGGSSGGVMEMVLKTLDETNRRIAESDVKKVAGFLFPPVAELEAELKTPPADSLRRHLELSALLYQSLSDSVRYNLSVLTARPINLP